MIAGAKIYESRGRPMRKLCSTLTRAPARRRMNGACVESRRRYDAPYLSFVLCVAVCIARRRIAVCARRIIRSDDARAATICEADEEKRADGRRNEKRRHDEGRRKQGRRKVG